MEWKQAEFIVLILLFRCTNRFYCLIIDRIQNFKYNCRKHNVIT